MVDSKRDPSIGPEWLAWYALQGDEDFEFVHRYLAQAQTDMGKFLAEERNNISRENEKLLSGILLFLIGLEEAADAGGTSDFKMSFVRRKAGKPVNKFERARRGHKAARRVTQLCDEGWKQEAAISQVGDETGLSRSEIFAWLRHRRKLVQQPADQSG